MKMAPMQFDDVNLDIKKKVTDYVRISRARGMAQGAVEFAYAAAVDNSARRS